jgi:hypothetical protein
VGANRHAGLCALHLQPCATLLQTHHIFTILRFLLTCVVEIEGSMRRNFHQDLLPIPPQDCGPRDETNSETLLQPYPTNHVEEAHHLLSSISMAQSASERSEDASVSSMSDQSLQDQKGSATAQKTEKAFSDARADSPWSPFVLRWYFVAIPITLSIVFAAVVSILYWVSRKNNGLCSEDAAMPGWKFVPTLFAVVYTQLTAMILAAVKRTEPFARMARPEGKVPVARYTLLEKSKPWWTTLTHGFQRKRNAGSWSWVLILSCIAYISAILGISPISAALLTTEEVHHSISEAVTQLTPRNGSTIHPRAQRDTYLRTMGALFQNYSTSPWIQDGYVILPFMSEATSRNTSLWAAQARGPGTLEKNTTVFRNEFVCTEMSLKRKDVFLRHALDDHEMRYSEKLYLASILLESAHGCQFNLTVNMTSNVDSPMEMTTSTIVDDWISWSDMLHPMFGESQSSDAVVRLNDDCSEDELIMLSTAWLPRWDIDDRLSSNLTIVAYACQSHHTMANVPVLATTKSNRLSVEFDRALFDQTRTAMDPTIIDLRELHDIYTSPDWSLFVPQGAALDRYVRAKAFGGSSAMLGIHYNFSVSTMMPDSELLVHAARVRHRFFAEVLGATFQHDGSSDKIRTTGVRHMSVRKIVVSGQAASIISALLLTSSLVLLVVLCLTRNSSRVLGVRDDPSTVLGLIAWASSEATVLRSFAKLDLASRMSLKDELAGKIYITQKGRLLDLGHCKRARQGLCMRRSSSHLLTSRRSKETIVFDNQPCVAWTTNSEHDISHSLRSRPFDRDFGLVHLCTESRPASYFFHVSCQRQTLWSSKHNISLRYHTHLACNSYHTLVGIDRHYLQDCTAFNQRTPQRKMPFERFGSFLRLIILAFRLAQSLTK